MPEMTFTETVVTVGFTIIITLMFAVGYLLDVREGKR